MNSNKFVIEYKGFQPLNETIVSLEKIMRVIKGKSPSSSFMKLTVNQHECHVSGYLTITSSRYKFSSDVYGDSTVDVMKSIQTDILKKLSLWSKNR